MSCFLGSPITQELIQEIQDAALQFYQQHGLFLAKVSLPTKQKLCSGVVHVIISEGILGKISANEPLWFSESLIRSSFRANEGEPLSWPQLRSN